MDFVAVDVETANPDLSSICQIAVVDFKDGAVAGSWQSLVDPEDYFDPRNTAIHGISEATVRRAPTIPALVSELQSRLAGALVASHTPFDRVAIFRALEKHRVPLIESRWLDTARVVRRAWPQFARSGYGLANVARHLGVVFEHHVAEEDARVAGEILLRAIAETGVGIEGWLHRATEPVGGSIAREGSEGGPLYGETMVFTGALSVPRREAAVMAAAVGCAVSEAVNRGTTILVVGDQDIGRLAGHDKSSKHRKVEELIQRGQEIRILVESDFRRLVQLEGIS